MIHGGSCLDEEERVYAVEILRLGVVWIVSRYYLPVVWTRRVVYAVEVLKLDVDCFTSLPIV